VFEYSVIFHMEDRLSIICGTEPSHFVGVCI